MRVRPLPAQLQPLWDTFLDLHNGRIGASGASAISFADIRAWEDLSGVRLNPWEVQVLKDMDLAAMRALDEQRKADRQAAQGTKP